MSYLFKNHYTLSEARSLLPVVRDWLEQLHLHQRHIELEEARLGPRLLNGEDLGGPRVNAFLRAWHQMQLIFGEFQRKEIQIKDLGRGLIDFPSLRNGKEVFLCWEMDEDDIEFWHDLDTGFLGRQPC